MNNVTILLVTNNQHKVEEIQTMLTQATEKNPTTYSLISLKSIPEPPRIEETGETFQENALCKNLSLLTWLYGPGFTTLEKLFPSGSGYLLADDSGLEVDALGGAPGIYSARYAARDSGAEGNSSDFANNEKLLRELKDLPPGKRTAHFACVLALTPIEVNADPGDLVEQTEFFSGTVQGHIAFEPHGGNGFGYDPLFIPVGYEESFAELGESLKNQMSHRARALKALVQFLNKSFRD